MDPEKSDVADTAPAGDAQDPTSEEGKKTPVHSPEEVKRLRDERTALKKQAAEFQKQLTELSKRYEGIDIEEIKALRQKAEDAEKKAAERDPAKMEDLFERKLNKHRSEWENEKQSISTEVERLRKENKTLKVTDKVMAEIATLFNPDALKWIKKEVEERCDIDEDGTIIVRGEDGEVMYKGARPMTPKEFGDALAEQFPSAAKPTGTGGTKDVAPGQKVSARGRDYSKLTYEEFAVLPNQHEIWKNHLSSDQRIAFAGRMKIGGQH